MRLACDLFVGLLESKGMTQPPVDHGAFGRVAGRQGCPKFRLSFVVWME